jgi:hypothetical protein
VARGVAGQVQRAHAHAAAELPHRAVAITHRVGPRRVVEVALDLAPQVVEDRLRVAVVPAQPREAARGVEVGLVHVHRLAGHQVQPGHVILVHMAEDRQVRIRQHPGDAVGDLRRVEHHPRVAAAHHNLVAVGVLAGLLAEVDANRAEVGEGSVVHGAQRPTAVKS